MHQKQPPANVAIAALAGLAFALDVGACACTSARPVRLQAAKAKNLINSLDTKYSLK
jgi:hypothetical protein